MSHAPDDKILLNVIQYEDRVTVIHDNAFTGKQRISKPVAADKSTPPVPNWTDNGVNWAYWGDNDRLPTAMRQKVELVPIAGAALKKKIDFMVGEDLQWFKTEELRKFGNKAEQVYDPEVEAFMEDNRIETEWWPAQCADYCLPFNCFSELILSNDRKKITGLYHIAAEHARLAKANKSNQVDWLIQSLHFPFGTAQDDTTRIAMPLYKWYDREKFLNGLIKPKFAWHSRYPTPGMIYYARAWWLGLFKDSGWMDVSAGVPKIVSAMQKNQMALKYIIAIPESYFIVRYPDWTTYESSQRQTIIDDKVADMNEYLSGVDNVYKSIAYVFKENEINGSGIGKIEITAVDDKAKSGTWVPDSYAADAQIVQGLGMDPSQIGLAPEGGKMGAGSGSDKMQSFNQLTLLNTTDQRIVMEPLNFISKYNGWGLTCIVKHSNLTTQDQNRAGVTSSPNPTPVI
jgi:hypothetical protein